MFLPGLLSFGKKWSYIAKYNSFFKGEHEDKNGTEEILVKGMTGVYVNDLRRQHTVGCV